ncbi:MAG: amino acid--tRNA ligase-related protein [Spirochaetales bacterium]
MISQEVAKARARLRSSIRAFFDGAGYLEVDTPHAATALIPEAHIEVFETAYVHPWEQGHPLFLIPSPEVHLKPLLGREFRNLYFLGHCFRNAESRSRLHNPEFTMLEWYTTNHGYLDSLALTERLLQSITIEPFPGSERVCAPVERITMPEAFGRFAGVSPECFAADGGMRRAAESLELRIGAADSEEDLFHRILISEVEPALPTDHPVALINYPAFVPTLAARVPSTPYLCERWELYIAGMEIANCYTEERDREKIAGFLEREDEAKRHGGALVNHPPATSLLEFSNAPPASGVALGFDRLLMALLGIDDIAGVIFSS